MIYDIAGDMTAQSGTNLLLLKKILDNLSNAAAGATNNHGQKSAIGLYDHAQFSKFQNNFKGATAAAISKSLVKLKTPTTYEALNYLIPSVDALGDEEQQFKALTINLVLRYKVKTYNLFAPLCGERYLLEVRTSDIIDALTGYLKTLAKPVEQFLEALKEVADFMMNAMPRIKELIPQFILMQQMVFTLV